MRKLNKKTGFTLAELLIVVAIIAILVAIGIPAFSTAMERSRETVDLSNIRGAYAEFIAGSLGGRADTGYYQVDIKQRDVKSWVVDSAGFLTNVFNTELPTDTKLGVLSSSNTDIGVSSKTPTTALATNAALKTGQMWVKFSFVDPTSSDGKTLLKVPTISFVTLTLDTNKVPQAPEGVLVADSTVTPEGGTPTTTPKNVVDYYAEQDITGTDAAAKKTKVGYWYLTKEQK